MDNFECVITQTLLTQTLMMKVSTQIVIGWNVMVYEYESTSHGCDLSYDIYFFLQVMGEYGMAHFSDKGKSKGKDYCIFFNSQWAGLPQDLNKAVSEQLVPTLWPTGQECSDEK